MKIMDKNTKKALLQVVLPIIGAAALLLFVYKKFGGSSKTIASNTSALSTTGFPLQNGSRGDLVKQLQAKLGVNVDGAFGPKTLAALMAKTGKTSVASQSELNAIS